MFFIIKTIHNLLKVLNSETAPSQIAAGVAFGMIVGLTPTMSLHNLVVFLVVCLFRVNLSMFFLSFGLFSIVGWAFDPVWDKFGFFLLATLKAARPFWITLTSGPILPFFRFNNTIVTGSLVAAFILFIPVFLEAIYLIKLYRRTVRDRIQDSKFFKILKATPVYGLIEKYQTLRQKFGFN